MAFQEVASRRKVAYFQHSAGRFKESRRRLIFGLNYIANKFTADCIDIFSILKLHAKQLNNYTNLDNVTVFFFLLINLKITLCGYPECPC